MAAWHSGLLRVHPCKTGHCVVKTPEKEEGTSLPGVVALLPMCVWQSKGGHVMFTIATLLAKVQDAKTSKVRGRWASMKIHI